MRKVDNKKEYVSINLPKDMVEELKLYRRAYSICYPTQDVTYEFMLRGMLDSLEDSDPAVFKEYCKMLERLNSSEAKG